MGVEYRFLFVNIYGNNFNMFSICRIHYMGGGIPLTEWLDEKERNEGNNFYKYIF